MDRIIVTAGTDAVPTRGWASRNPAAGLALPLRFDVGVQPQAIAGYELGGDML